MVAQLESDNGQYPSHKSIRRAQHDHVVALANSQIQENAAKRLSPRSVSGSRLLLEAFLNSSEFIDIYQAANSYYKEVQTEDFLRSIRTDLAGAVFQGIGMLDLQTRFAHKSSKNRVLLSSERTLAFYKTLYPGAEVVGHPFGLDSLAGVSVPDAVVCDPAGKLPVDEVVEISLRARKDNFDAKYEAFLCNRDKFPYLFAKSTAFSFVVPVESTFHRGEETCPNLAIRKIPTTATEVGKFTNDIIYTYRPDPTEETLAELQIAARKRQAGKAIFLAPSVPVPAR